MRHKLLKMCINNKYKTFLREGQSQIGNPMLIYIFGMSESNQKKRKGVKGTYSLIPKCKEAQIEKGIVKTNGIEIEGGIYLLG